jgi:peptidoglycan/xylan/chitin deacetylase (PgdA/CDA1 family)
MKLAILSICIFFLTGASLPPGEAGTCARPGLAVLTFDDGMNPSTSRILDILDREQAPAAFFVIGSTLLRPAGRQALTRIQASGYEAGNHTWSHRNLIRLKDADIIKEAGSTQSLLPVFSRYVRPPYGAVNRRVHGLLSGMGFTVVMWNLDIGDWSRRKSQAALWRSFQRQTARALPEKTSLLILLHSVPKTAALLPFMTGRLRGLGFQLASLSECLRRKDSMPAIISLEDAPMAKRYYIRKSHGDLVQEQNRLLETLLAKEPAAPVLLPYAFDTRARYMEPAPSVPYQAMPEEEPFDIDEIPYMTPLSNGTARLQTIETSRTEFDDGAVEKLKKRKTGKAE